jgi:hypothetical protein
MAPVWLRIVGLDAIVVLAKTMLFDYIVGGWLAFVSLSVGVSCEVTLVGTSRQCGAVCVCAGVYTLAGYGTLDAPAMVCRSVSQ